MPLVPHALEEVAVILGKTAADTANDGFLIYVLVVSHIVKSLQNMKGLRGKGLGVETKWFTVCFVKSLGNPESNMRILQILQEPKRV